VRQTGKSASGDITKLCSPGQPWSPRSLADAISDIESGAHSYFVDVQTPALDVSVVQDEQGKHLTTTSNPLSRNNLSNLPNG
jgi:hypothetical protein